MSEFGIDNTRLHTLGNLKFDTPAIQREINREIEQLLPQNRKIITAGSTHPGEEELFLKVYKKLKTEHPDLFLIIVPRNPDRAHEIATLAADNDLMSHFRSDNTPSDGEGLLIVDTIGELIDIYRTSWLAFVGGSLVPSGGHNPIEPALFGVPVIFGPHMEDFSEIAAALIENGGASTINDTEGLQSLITGFLDDESTRVDQGNHARDFVAKQKGVIDKHLDLIRSLL